MQLLGHHHGMGRTPRLGPFSRDRVPGGNLVQFLESVVYVRARLVFSADPFPKITLDVSTDNENDLAESRTERIVNRIVEDDFTAGADFVELFQTAVATTDSSSKNKKCRLFTGFHKYAQIFKKRLNAKSQRRGDAK